MKRLLLFLAIGFVFMSPFSAYADYIVDTGSGWEQFGVSVYNRSNGDVQFNAGQFTITQPNVISSLETWMYSSNPGSVEMVLYGDNGNLPDPSREFLRQSFSVMTSAQGPVTAWQGVSGLNLALDPGFYWISLEKSTVADGFSVNLPSGAPDPLARYAYFDENTGGNWVNYTGAQGFRVAGNVLPEPASMLLFGVGAVAMALFRRKT